MPLLSAALYGAQFICPFIISFCNGIFENITKLPFIIGIIIAIIFVLWSWIFFRGRNHQPIN